MGSARHVEHPSQPTAKFTALLRVDLHTVKSPFNVSFVTIQRLLGVQAMTLRYDGDTSTCTAVWDVGSVVTGPFESKTKHNT
jgi:hypothetical protein